MALYFSGDVSQKVKMTGGDIESLTRVITKIV